METTIALLITLFLFGLVFGSFASVCAWRIPRGESIVFPASHCPTCSAAIPWRYNIPLIGYLMLRGRCSSCRVRISPLYPSVELSCGILFLSQGLQFPSGPMLLLGLVFSFTLLALSVIDLQHQIIPDVFSLGLLLAGLISSPWNAALGEGPGSRAVAAMVGALTGFGMMFFLAWFGEKLFRKEALGGGDIKLMAAVGAFVGWKGVLAALFIGSFCGAAAVALLMPLGRLKRGDYLPFGPFLALGSWVAWLGGERVSSLFFELPFG